MLTNRLFYALLCALSCQLFGAAGVGAAPPQYAFRIAFTDKAGAPPLSATPPWLSARALARRSNYGIALDSTDRPVSPAYVDSVLRITGGRLHNTSRWLNHCVVLLTDSSKIVLLSGKLFIRSIAWTGYFGSGLHQRLWNGTKPRAKTADIQPALEQAKSTGSSAYYGAAWPQTTMVNGDYLHDLGYRGDGQIIAVLDEGFIDVPTHPGFDSMRRNGRLLETYNFVQDTGFIYINSNHGTQCLSTMAGLLPGTYVGAAPRASYALYLTEDVSFTDALYEPDNLIAGMERADSLGADVISCSLGYNTFVSPYTTAVTKAELNGHTTLAARAVNFAVGKGIFYVSSAGNEGTNPDWNFLLTPSDADSALTVGSVNTDRSASGFSSPGPNSSGRVKPDVCLQGGPAAIFNTGGGVTTSGGTSYSAPQAAGYAACLKQAFSRATPARIREAISRSADRYSAPTAKLGYGIPDFNKVFQSLATDGPVLPQGISAQPNPFGDFIAVRLPASAQDLQVVLSDVAGRSIMINTQVAGGVMRVIVPRDLPCGTYVLRVMAGGNVYIQKLVHQ